MSRQYEQKYIDGFIKSALAHSHGRVYAQGITQESSERPNIATWALQNLDATNDLRIWYGLVPVDPLDENTGYLPEDATSWSAGQISSAETTLATYGEKVGPGQYLEPFIAPSAEIYIYAAVGPINAHIKEG